MRVSCSEKVQAAVWCTLHVPQQRYVQASGTVLYFFDAMQAAGNMTSSAGLPATVRNDFQRAAAVKKPRRSARNSIVWIQTCGAGKSF